MKNQNNGIGIAMVYIGTLIGAGFASGQELFQFFGQFGVNGLIGMGMAGLCFAFIGYAVLRIASKNKKIETEEIMFPLKWKPLQIFMSVFFGFFLFGIIVVMLAGSGAMVKEQFGIPSWIGAVVMAVLALLTSLLGRDGIIKSFKIVVPFLIFGMLAVILFTLFSVKWGEVSLQSYDMGKSWIVSAILFVSYNMIVAVSVLAPLGKGINKKSTALTGALLGGLTLGVVGFAAVLSMVVNANGLAGVEVPLVYLAAQLSENIGNLYTVILFAGIYTTAVGCLFALEEKLIPVLNINLRLLNAIIMVIALVLSNVGFSKLVGTIYPISGYIGLIILVGVTISFFKTGCQKQKEQED